MYIISELQLYFCSWLSKMYVGLSMFLDYPCLTPVTPDNLEYTAVMYHSSFAVYTFNLYCLGIGDLIALHSEVVAMFC
jgi:hypothetical protein